MQIPTRPLSALFYIILAGLLCSCTDSFQTNNSYILRLKNRGLVPLSSDNPYIAANALIYKEMENSKELRGFIEHSGAPSAIKVEKGNFSPLFIDMYYPEKKQYFKAEENLGIWIINGPFQISEKNLSDIKKVLIFNAGPNKVPLPIPSAVPEKTDPSGKENAPGEFTSEEKVEPVQKEMTPAEVVDAPRRTIVPKETPKPVATVKAVFTMETPLPKAEEKPIVLDMNKDKGLDSTLGVSVQSLVMKYGKSLAETSPKGDVVHYISYPGETLPMISRWYTFDKDNQLKISRINGISSKPTLNLGDSVIIPGYLVKNKYLLTEEALSALESAVAEGKIK